MLTPDSLLQSPCDGIPPGETVRELAKAYVGTTSCLQQHKLLLEKQKKYREEIEKVYGKSN
jgi:hypothetical protein